MLLSFNKYGDINVHGGRIVTSSMAQAYLGRFMFFAATKRFNYIYDQTFGNTVHTMLGKTNTQSNLSTLRKVLEEDISRSGIFGENAIEVKIVNSSRHRVMVQLIGQGIDASWELMSTNRGISLNGFVDGTDAVSSAGNVICDKVFTTVSGQISYDITSVYNDCMNKNNISSIDNVEFNHRVLFKAVNTTEARILRTDEYELKESLTKRTVDFYRTLSADGTLTIQLWPLESVVTQSNNPYLLRRGRTSNPTTKSSTY